MEEQLDMFLEMLLGQHPNAQLEILKGIQKKVIDNLEEQILKDKEELSKLEAIAGQIREMK